MLEEMNKMHEIEEINKSVVIGQEGLLKPVLKDASGAKYSYYEFLPNVYIQNNQKFPLIVFLHGAGEVGDSSSSSHIIKRVLKHGLPFLISKNLWIPKYPCVVISPQNPVYGWNPEDIHSFIQFIIDNYNIDIKRVYLTGISMGGFGIFSYLGKYGNKSGIAAAIPICGGGDIQYAARLKNIPLWAFHGEADNVVNVKYSINIVNAINRLNPELKPKLTIFPKVKHNSWAMTYSGAGMGKESPQYDRFDIPIWDWMYRYELI